MLFLLFSLTFNSASVCEVMKCNLLVAVEWDGGLAIDFGGAKALHSLRGINIFKPWLLYCGEGSG